MMRPYKFAIVTITLILLKSAPLSANPDLDETPAGEGEWGYRPSDSSVSAVNPPSFSWRPMPGMSWELQCSKDASFSSIIYNAEHIEFNVITPNKPFAQGNYYWRYRGISENGDKTNWSRIRSFTITGDASKMPLPEREELLSRIPDSHPRLFIRPEEIPTLKKRASSDLKNIYERLSTQCKELIENPPDLSEPQLYPNDIVRGSDEWRSIWWGNRMRVVKALNSAATLAFTSLIGGPDIYGMEAKRILMACAEWDPKGSTGYLYNDEAGMPYNYLFSRTYSFVYNLLSETEREKCREVMLVRGREMYDHMCPGHFWTPV